MKLTLEELKNSLQELQSMDSPEAAHADAVQLLIEHIDDVEVTHLFKQLPKPKRPRKYQHTPDCLQVMEGLCECGVAKMNEIVEKRKAS